VATSASEEGRLNYEGWRVVLAAHLGTMVSFGSLLVFTFGIFLKPLADEFGWSREEISRGFAIAAMTVAVASPFLGMALDRFPPRRIILGCFVIFGSGVMLLSALKGSLWQLYFTFFLIGIAGNGTTQMGYSGVVSSWFTAKRGLAIALVVAGVGIGSIVHPLLAERVIAAQGWRTAYLVLGALVFLLGIPATAIFVRKKPGVVAKASGEGKTGAGLALRSREFWLLVGVLFLSSVAANGTLTHMAAHLTDKGMAAASAALATGILGGANLAGRLTTGWLLDRMFGPRLSMWLLLLMAAGFLLLVSVKTLPLAIVAALLIGVGLGGEADVTPYLLSRYFALENFSLLYGLTWTFYAVAGAMGPVIFGRVFDTAGTYTAVLQLAAVLTLISAGFMLLMRPYPESRQ
jgi:predicted MFS family arabinose efflux permease